MKALNMILPRTLALILVVALINHAASAAQYFLRMQADDSRWVTAAFGGGGAVGDSGYPRGAVDADANRVGLFEQFILNDLNGSSLMDGDSVTLRTRSNGLYLAAEGGGGGAIRANRILAGSWEIFTIKKMNGTGEIKDGDLIALQVNNGKWICAENGGGNVLVADRSSPGAWETFVIDLSSATPSTYWTSANYSASYWNDFPYGSIQMLNNCYNYAANRRTDTFAQPGKASGYPITVFSGFALDLALFHDGFESTTSSGTSAENKMKIYCAIWPWTDFHFYRRDNNGMWSGKPGYDEATNLDHSGNTISNPSTADRGNYTEELGYYFVSSINANQGDSLPNVK